MLARRIAEGVYIAPEISLFNEIIDEYDSALDQGMTGVNAVAGLVKKKLKANRPDVVAPTETTITLAHRKLVAAVRAIKVPVLRAVNGSTYFLVCK